MCRRALCTRRAGSTEPSFPVGCRSIRTVAPTGPPCSGRYSSLAPGSTRSACPVPSRRLRVLVLTPDFPPSPGGIQLVMHRLVTHFEHFEATVITVAAEDAEAFDEDQSVRIIRSPRTERLGNATRVGLLNMAAVANGARLRPDVVLSGHIAVAPAARVLKEAMRIPYLQYLHGREIVMRPRMAELGIRDAAAIVAVSRYTEQLAAEHGAERQRLHLIPPGVDVPALNGKARVRGRGTIVCVSRLDERYKGHDVLIRAMPLVRARIEQASLLLVGDGPRRGAYEQLAKSLRAAEYISFLGRLTDDERDRVLSEADVFALPSRLSRTGGEGFGIVFSEAAASGLPVIAGGVAGTLDAVVDGETGVLVDPTDHVAVADALSDLLADPSRARALGRAGAARAQQFAWPLVARRVEDVLLQIARQ